MKRVVITGIGIISTIGRNKEEFFHRLLSQETAIERVPQKFELHSRLKSRFYSPLPDIRLADYQIPDRMQSSMQPEDLMSVCCAKMALEDAQIHFEPKSPYFITPELHNASVIIGVGLSSLDRVFKSFLAHVLPDPQKVSQDLDTKLVFNRMIIPQTMPNSPSAWTSIFFGFGGTVFTMNAACASGTFAIGESFRRIQSGTESIMITGGVECMKDEFGATMRGFDALGALTQSEDGLPRPFSLERSGFLFSEGGCCLLVLEEMERALGRNADIYAEITDYTANSDAHNIVQMNPSGEKIIQLLKRLKLDNRIDYINTHGTATEANDQIESLALREVFGNENNPIAINSTKGIIGHTIGASGAIETAVTALSIKRSKVHGNITQNPIEGMELVMESQEREIQTAITTSYGFGGHNAGLVLKKFQR